MYKVKNETEIHTELLKTTAELNVIKKYSIAKTKDLDMDPKEFSKLLSASSIVVGLLVSKIETLNWFLESTENEVNRG